MDLHTFWLMLSLFCFALVGLFMWAIHYGPLSMRGE